MPKLEKYTYNGPVDCSVPVDKSKLAGKSVVITGGANGMGETFVRSFVAAGSFVTFADVNAERGKTIVDDLGSDKCHFVACDVTSWDDQVNVFEAAISKSPSRTCDVVIANAGISRADGDSLWDLDDPNQAPVKPKLKIVDVNLTGTLYTWKLAVHYFRKQDDGEDRDRCFIMTGSLVAWIDSPANWQYTVTKYGLRGLMRTVRRSSWEQGIRINYVAPCYIKSAIRSPDYEKWLTDQGVEFAPTEDVAGCMMRIASDKTINGHSLMITPRRISSMGFIDVEDDDHVQDGYFKDLQAMQLRIIQDQWLDGEVAQGRK